MAWGVFNKIKQGFKKVGKALKKGADWLNEKVIKPFKPIIGAAATAINPALGMGLNTAMGAVEKFSDEGWGSTTKKRFEPDDGVSAVKWAKRRFG